MSSAATTEPPIPEHAATGLAALVQHRQAVDHLSTLEEIHQRFRMHRADYFAVLREGRVLGLCARSQIGFILGSRFGFSLYSNSTAHTALVQNPIIVPADTPPHELLARAFARQGDDFYDDIVLVDGDGGLLGLISTEALVKLQSQLMAGQMERLRNQHLELHQQNLDLFRTNHALRQSRGLYQGLFESNTLGVALLDPEGNIQAHNHRLAELLGLPAGGETSASLLDWVSEREREGFRDRLRTHESDGGDAAGTVPQELVLQPQGRGPRRFRITTGWIPETGQVCACLDDVTDQRSMEQMMLRQEKQNLLDTLVGGIAHELNNKLTPVLGFADLLNAQSGANTAAFAASIKQSALEAAGIIRQLLQLSKPARGQFQPADLRTVVEDSLVMLRFQVREARCELRLDLPSDPVPVRADSAQLKQVVINLVLNALQATAGRPDPRVEIAIATRGERGLIVVSDNGPGIAPEHLGRVFDPFFTTKDPDKGTGLGLSICQSLVRQHDGEIAAESAPGDGARLTVSLPLNLAPDRTAPAVTPALRPMARNSPDTPDCDRAQVLIVEDEEIVRGLLQELLRGQTGCRVTLACNGAEGLAALRKTDFDLVLSDIRMPVMSGTELYLRIREARPDLARRFVFVTGHPGDKQLEGEISSWGVPLLYKPFEVVRLNEVCRPFLRKARADGRTG